MVNQPEACPARMSRKALGVSPTGRSRMSRPEPMRNLAKSGWVQLSRPEMRSEAANTSAGS